MERAPGVELQHVWHRLSHVQKYDVVKAVVDQETKLMSSTFDAIGSLYYAEQMEGAISVHTNFQSQGRRFVIGPTTERCFVEGVRGEFACDRGPCMSGHQVCHWISLTLNLGLRVEDYLVAIGRRELICVERNERDSPSAGIFGSPGCYKPSAATKMTCLQDYIKIAQYLPPHKDPSVSAPVLWHFDLHDGNIFVHPEQPTQITCIIDWQYASVRPLFRHAGHPAFLDFPGPKPLLGVQGDAGKIPGLPENYNQLSQKEQKAARSLVHQQKLYKTYEMYCAVQNPNVHNALRFGETVQAKLIALIDSVSSHSELVVKALLMEVEGGWDEIRKPNGLPCPIEFSECDRRNLAEEFPKWMHSTALLHAILEKLGVESKYWDGQVTSERFSAQKEVLENVREGFLNQATTVNEERAQWIRAWPFKDDEDI